MHSFALMEKECIACKAGRVGEVWAPGETCLFGMLFCCSFSCAETWAKENAREGYKPGEPYFFADVEAWPDCSGCIEVDSDGELVAGVRCPEHGPIGRQGNWR